MPPPGEAEESEQPFGPERTWSRMGTTVNCEDAELYQHWTTHELQYEEEKDRESLEHFILSTDRLSYWLVKKIQEGLSFIDILASFWVVKFLKVPGKTWIENNLFRYCLNNVTVLLKAKIYLNMILWEAKAIKTYKTLETSATRAKKSQELPVALFTVRFPVPGMQ